MYEVFGLFELLPLELLFVLFVLIGGMIMTPPPLVLLLFVPLFVPLLVPLFVPLLVPLAPAVVFTTVV